VNDDVSIVHLKGVCFLDVRYFTGDKKHASSNHAYVENLFDGAGKLSQIDSVNINNIVA